MKLFFTVNLQKGRAKEVAVACCCLLTQAGASCFLSDSHRAAFQDSGFQFVPDDTPLDPFDFMVAIGGDGTIMGMGKKAVLYDKPILGINAGRLGFMAGLETEDLAPICRLLSGDFIEQPRLLLEITVENKEKKEQFIAINELLITKSSLSGVIDLEISCREKPVSTYRADGILFSTPTGSTAYALSNGGPIADPLLEYISMSPICPHSFDSKTFLFSPQDTLVATLGAQNRNRAFAVVDGQPFKEIHLGDRVLIRASEKKLRLITLNHRPFFQVVAEKFIANETIGKERRP